MEAVQGVPRVLTSGGSTYRDYEATRAELDRARAHLNLIASRDVIDAVNVYAGVWRDMNRAALGEGNLDVEAFVESAEQGEHELFLMNAMRDQLPEFAGALAAAEEHVNEAMRRDIGTWEDERQANDPDVADRRAEA